MSARDTAANERQQFGKSELFATKTDPSGHFRLSPRSGSTADNARWSGSCRDRNRSARGVCSGTIPSKNDTERSGARLIASHLYFKRTVTPPTAADTSAPTFGPLSYKIMPLAFCN